jgi:4-alpha-glucanotransferase
MKYNRSSGILLHPTSLPGCYGIGDIGPQAYRWIDFLVETGCGLWQVLPLGPTGYGDSPYNVFIVCWESIPDQSDLLIAKGCPDDLSDCPRFPDFIDYGAAIPVISVRCSYDRFRPKPKIILDQYENLKLTLPG